MDAFSKVVLFYVGEPRLCPYLWEHQGKQHSDVSLPLGEDVCYVEQTGLCYSLVRQFCSAIAWGKAVLLPKGYTHSTAHSLPSFPVLTAEKDQEGRERELPMKKGKEPPKKTC